MGKKRIRSGRKFHALKWLWSGLAIVWAGLMTQSWTQAGTESAWLRVGPGVINHPVGVVPSNAIRIPAGWPLDANGAITCLTCHTSIDMRGSRGGQLRSTNGIATEGREFCASCHGVDGPPGSSKMHWMAIRRAHVTEKSLEAVKISGSLDHESRNCLACHDGVGASETAYETGHSHGMGSFGDRSRNHPIGVKYPRGGFNRRGSKFHAEAALPAQVLLPGGAVSCVSCHNLYATSPGHLSVPIEESNLCFACHDMR